MATVYLAEDLRHARRVAVKVLKPELAAVIGAERFLQEIKLTAGLQHAHILPLHDSGVVDGLLYYVMPYVEGETLRQRLTREKQLEIPVAVEFARQVASALDYAHRRGIIHRDIKPENVLIHDRQALVADFGIALAVSSAGGTSRMTETGMSLGTPQYMSPEQAMGDRELDARSDIYSLGAMLYEMLAGDPPYTGSTAQAIVAKVITEKAPPVTTLRETVPLNVAATIQKALAKLPADRFHSAAEFSDALANPNFAPTLSLAGALPTPRQAGWTRWLWPATAAVLAAVVVWSLLRTPKSAPVSVARYGLSFPKDQAPLSHPWQTFALAPDASWLVYSGPLAGAGEQLWVKSRERFEATALVGTTNAWAPTASPDGRWIAYLSPDQGGGSIRKIPLQGGAAVTLADSAAVVKPASTVAWGDDDVLTYTDRSWRLRRVPAAGGASKVAYTPPPGRFAVGPNALPGGRGLLFVLCDGACRRVQDLWVLDLRSGDAKLLMSGVASAWYAPSGQVVYGRRDGAFFSAPFDLGSLALKGSAVPVLDGVLVPTTTPQFVLAANGTVLYAAGKSTANPLAEAVWVGLDGKATPVDTTWRFDANTNSGWSISPDGKRLAIKLNTDAGQHIWVKQLNDGPVSRITFDSATYQRPRWLPDGKTVSYIADRSASPLQTLFTRSGDGTGVEQLKVRFDKSIWEAVWSRDGKWLVLRTGGIAGALGGRDVYALQLGVDSAPRPLLVTPADEKAIALSPDNRWLAYESNESGRDEVYVRPFPNVEAGKWQVSINGGTFPLWSHKGGELFYLDNSNDMMTLAQIGSVGGFTVRQRRPLFKLDDSYQVSVNYTPWELAPDDRRFLMVRLPLRASSDPASLILIENWFEELKQKLRK